MLAHPNAKIIEALASTLGAYRGKDTRNILLKLCTHKCDGVRKASATSLLEILERDAIVYLSKFKNDQRIIEVLTEYINDNSWEVELN